MPKTCCVVGCSNHNMMLKKLSFHKFPKDENRRALWLTALKRNNPDGTVWMPTKNSVVCNAHFISGNLEAGRCGPNTRQAPVVRAPCQSRLK
jgi:hypothetical protein